MKRKLKSKTTTWEYEDSKVTHIKTYNVDQLFYFSGSQPLTHWDVGGGYIDLAPKGNFITKFVKRLWNMRKLEKLLK